ncbi:unnamed protein product, partial [Meganyctiphanes norvegica]
DMDYMICTNPQPFPITALWSKDRYFADPGGFAYRCREITSTHKIDLDRCVTASEALMTSSVVPSTTPLKGLLCPPHMVAVGLYWPSPRPQLPVLTCCLLYDP